MQPRHPHRPVVRTVRRELTPSRPAKRRRRRLARLRTFLLLTVLVGGGWYLWPRNPSPQAEALPVVTIRSGAVEERLEADGLIARQEAVFTAPVSGQLRRLTSDGERVRVGTAVAEILPAASPPAQSQETAQETVQERPRASSSPAVSAAQREYDRLNGEVYRLAVAINNAKYSGDLEQAASLEAELDQVVRQQAVLLDQLNRAASPSPASVRPAPPPPPTQTETPTTSAGQVTRLTSARSGILLYQTDGLEGLLAPSGAVDWTPSWLRTLPSPELKQNAEGLVAAGSPVFKVVDDLDLHLILVVEADRLTPAQRTVIAEQGVQVRLSGQGRLYTARVRRIVEEGSELLLHLTIPSPVPESLRVRRMRVTLLLETHEGIIVPRSSIDVVDGRTGVWHRTGGQDRFVPVRVIGGNQAEVAVEGDLPPDAQVLKEAPPRP